MQNNRDSATQHSDIRCHVCSILSVEVVSGYETFRRVTSDCMPWHCGGRLGVCRSCGCIQKVVDSHWQSETDKIYRSYNIYHQAQGAEQMSFEQGSGQASARSIRLLESLKRYLPLPKTGRLLDVGCGNGALLRAFSRVSPHWTLVGTELNDKYRAIVESIDRVEKLYLSAPEEVPGIFNIISMVHLLEHIPHPSDFLMKVRNKLTSDGVLVLEVPNYLQNPFDLLIADHCTHFTNMTLAMLLQRTGYEVISIAVDWVPKEFTVVARRMKDTKTIRPLNKVEDSLTSVSSSLSWLRNCIIVSTGLAKKGMMGIFGTSIAATWLCSEIPDIVSFFVDEDTNRVNRPYMGRPVFLPVDVPLGSVVFVVLPALIAEAVAKRVEKQGVKYYWPSQFS
jgi:2-polyprenyl-3-methyl-5-hydroxy-6-metoxy-1,4-benzoquinol methylase